MFDITQQDVIALVDSYVDSFDPLVFREIPAKEKRKYIILCMVIHYFKKDVLYSEQEVNQILKPMLTDHVMIRRYLVDYGFLERTENGSSYWLVKDPKDYLMYRIDNYKK